MSSGKLKCAITLRGHIRDGFTNNDLNKFILALSSIYDLDVYCQTWHENEAKKSYRALNRQNISCVTPEIIRKYFSYPITDIKIQKETDFRIKGRWKGNVSRTPMPIINWKYMLRGMLNATEMCLNKQYDLVINTRYDFFTRFGENSEFKNNICPKKYSNNDLVKQLKNFDPNKVNWLVESTSGPYKWCIDNFYFGTQDKLHELNLFMINDIDILLKEIRGVPYQEHYFWEAQQFLQKQK